MGLFRRDKLTRLKGQNLLDLVPVRQQDWELTPENRVEILVPKFTNRYLRAWLQPRLRYPYIRVKLDEIGSEVWRNCDGCTTVAKIGSILQERFGDKIEPVYDRLAAFLRQSVRSELMSLEIAPGAN